MSLLTTNRQQVCSDVTALSAMSSWLLCQAVGPSMTLYVYCVHVSVYDVAQHFITLGSGVLPLLLRVGKLTINHTISRWIPMEILITTKLWSCYKLDTMKLLLR